MFRTVCLAFLGATTALQSVATASDFKTLMSNVPEGANALMVIDVQRALASPLAQANGWSGRFDTGSAERPLYLPPEADKVIVAAQIDQARGFSRQWEVAVMGLTESMPMSLIARAEGGHADMIDGVKVAWVPSDAYFIEIDANTLGLMAPANRQAISRWASNRANGVTHEISPYLAAVGASAGSGPQFVLGLDMANAVQPHRLRTNLESSAFVKSHKLNLDDLVTLISGLRGVVLQVSLTDKSVAKAQIDFSGPVGMTGEAAKMLVLAALDNLQMAIPGTENWSCSVKGNSILMSGDLTSDSLRRVMSIMEIPTTKFSSLKEENTEKPSGDDMAQNSLAYFKSIGPLLRDLKSKSKSHASDAYWIDRYAAQIDKLPILHVDDDLLKYGENLSQTLRVMSGSRKMTNLEGGFAARGAMNEGGGVNYNAYGYGSYTYSTPSTRERNAGIAMDNAAAVGTSVKVQGWNLIDNATVEIRREMTKRYNIEF